MGFDRHPAIKQMLDAVRAEARKHELQRIIGMIETDYEAIGAPEKFHGSRIVELIKGDTE